MLNDVKPPPLRYGEPDPHPSAPPTPQAAPLREPPIRDVAQPAIPAARIIPREAAYSETVRAEYDLTPDPGSAPAGRRVPIIPIGQESPGLAHQPVAHRDALAGRPEMTYHDPAAARTPAVVRRLDASPRAGGAASRNPKVDPDVARGARRGDVSDGATYEYPSRGSLDSLSLSVVVILAVVLTIGYIVFKLF